MDKNKLVRKIYQDSKKMLWGQAIGVYETGIISLGYDAGFNAAEEHFKAKIQELESNGLIIYGRKIELLNNKIKELEQQLKKAEEVIEFYGNEMNYSVDDYHGISGEMRTRCVLYKDCEERNDVYSYAGKLARQYLKSKGEVK